MSIKTKINTLLFILLIALGAFTSSVLTGQFIDKKEGILFLLMKNDALLENVVTSLKSDLSDQGLFTEIKNQYQKVKSNYSIIQNGGKMVYGNIKSTVKPLDNDNLNLILNEQVKNINYQITFLESSGTSKELPKSVEAYIIDKNRLIREYNDQFIIKLKENRKNVLLIYTLIDFLLLIVFFVVFVLMYKQFNKYLFNYLKNISETIPKFLAGENSQLINEKEPQDPLMIEIIKHIEHLGTNVKYATEFAKEIGEGNFNYELEINDKDDSLGLALEDMRLKLKSYSEQEAKRIWTTEGIAKFAQIVRENNDNLFDLGKNVVSSLVKYLDANQGGLYITATDKNNDQYLELTGHYAFEKQRYTNQKVYSEDNLLGRVLQDKDTIKITDIPENYISIGSGLGTAVPKCILIVPLKVNDELHGAIEIASFNNLEEYKIRFVENIAESIASSISTVKMNTNTKSLLDESQKLTLQLQAKEDEMTRSMEQLQNAQAEMKRNQIELDGVFNSINQTLATVEFSIDGRILKGNNNSSQLLGYDLDELVGKYHSHFLKEEDANIEEYNNFWHELSQNHSKSGDFNWICKGNKEIWINTTFTPVTDSEGIVFKVIMLAKDITEEKEEELEFKKLSIVTNNTDNSVIITSKEGYIEYVNPGFTKLTGYISEEVLGKKPEDFLNGPDTSSETISNITKKLSLNEPFYEEILNYTKNGTSYWISLAVNPVFNESGTIEQYVHIQTNITDTKSRAIDFSSKLDAISKSNAIMEIGLDECILEMNENALKAFGFERENILQKSHKLILDEAFKNADEYTTFWSKLKKGEFIKGEFKRLGKYNKEVWLRGIYSPIFDVNNTPYKFVFFGVDITDERKLREATLKKELELRENAKAINVTVASVEFNMTGHINDVNDIFLGVTGFTKEELLDQHYETLLPEIEKGKPQHELMWENLKRGKFFSGEFKIISKTGKDLYLNSTYNPIMDDDGSPKKVMMFAQFTTDEKAKEVGLMGAARALKTSLPTFELKENGSFKTANQLFMDIFGYKRLQLRKLDIQTICPSLTEAAVKLLLDQIQVADFFEKELALVTSTGESIKKRITFTPIKSLEGTLDKTICIIL